MDRFKRRVWSGPPNLHIWYGGVYSRDMPHVIARRFRSDGSLQARVPTRVSIPRTGSSHSVTLRSSHLVKVFGGSEKSRFLTRWLLLIFTEESTVGVPSWRFATCARCFYWCCCLRLYADFYIVTTQTIYSPHIWVECVVTFSRSQYFHQQADLFIVIYPDNLFIPYLGRICCHI